MILYCHFQIKPLNKIGYTFAWRDRLSSMNSELTILEADNHSDVYLISQTSKMILEAEKMVCVFDVFQDESFGSLAKVLEAIRKYKGSILIFILGKNKKLEKSLTLLGQPTHKTSDEDLLIATISKFFKA